MSSNAVVDINNQQLVEKSDAGTNGVIRKTVLPAFIPFSNVNEFWANDSNWDEISPFFKSSEATEKFLTPLEDLMHTYAKDRTAAPFGFDFAIMLMSRMPNLFRKSWGPNYQRIKLVAHYQCAGLSLNPLGVTYAEPMRVMMSLVGGKYRKVFLRGGISSGCTDTVKGADAFDNKRIADYAYYQTLGLDVNSEKRGVTISYKRVCPFEVDESERSGHDCMMTMFEVMCDIHARKHMAKCNIENEKLIAKSSGDDVAELQKKLMPLSVQESIGKASMSDQVSWQSTAYGYMNVDVVMPKYKGSPEMEEFKYSFPPGSSHKPIFGSKSHYNPDIIVYDDDVKTKIESKLRDMEEAAKRKAAKSSNANNADASKSANADKKKKDPTPTRLTRVISWDEKNPSSPPLTEPITDLRPYVNLGKDWIVPAFVIIEGPFQTANTNFPAWHAKIKAHELMLFDPIFSPMASKEDYEEIRKQEDAKVTVLKDAASIYEEMGIATDMFASIGHSGSNLLALPAPSSSNTEETQSPSAEKSSSDVNTNNVVAENNVDTNSSDIGRKGDAAIDIPAQSNNTNMIIECIEDENETEALMNIEKMAAANNKKRQSETSHDELIQSASPIADSDNNTLQKEDDAEIISNKKPKINEE